MRDKVRALSRFTLYWPDDRARERATTDEDKSLHGSFHCAPGRTHNRADVWPRLTPRVLPQQQGRHTPETG